MPRVTEQPVRAFAHCVNPRCPGYAQAEVDALERTTAFTYAERGGDMPGVETSTVNLAFADESDCACPHCGANRDLSDKPRVRYQNLSGHAQDGLLHMQGVPAHAAPDVASLQAQIAELQAQLGEAA